MSRIVAAGRPTLIHQLVELAARVPDRIAYHFLATGEVGGLVQSIDYGTLHRRVCSLAGRLRERATSGERALLLYPPGLDYVTAFLACLHAGIVAVPAYPPDPARMQRMLPRLRAIAVDSEARIVMTLSAIEAMAGSMATALPQLAQLQWMSTDEGGDDATSDSDPSADAEGLAFLQYTSGSTGTPRGVMVRHRNLMHNGAQVHAAFGFRQGDIIASWLPPYHDMGLMGGILQTLYNGETGVLMSPAAFLRRPMRWLEAIAHFGAAVSGGPNFAYDLCVRKASVDAAKGLDLSSWRVAFNGAEPVRHETVERFIERFGPAGFRSASMFPCYGLAELTLFASGGPHDEPAASLRVDPSALATLRVEPRPDGVTLIGSGAPAQAQDVCIVEPQACTAVEPGQVGEIWIRGEHVAAGYWRKTEASEETFAASLVPDGRGPFLRTGDLGFLHAGQLFITGRRKDVVVIRGRNLWPQDVEQTLEACHRAVRPGGVAAFSMSDAHGEGLGVLVEVRDTDRLAEVSAAARRAIVEHHGVDPRTVALIAPGGLPKTSSGKVQRYACQTAVAEQSLELLWRDDARPLEVGAPSDGQTEPDGGERPGDEASDDAAVLPMSVMFFSSDAEASEEPYRLFLDVVRRADRLGFEAVWIPERHFHPFGGLFPNPATLGAAVATCTERLQIRAGSVVAPLHDPLRIAEEWAVVDRLSGGRTGIAFAVGWNPNDFVLGPDRHAERRAVTYEAIETVRALWRGEAIERTNGEGASTSVRVFPRLEREPPLWMTCSGGEERFVEAGTRGFHVLTALLFQTPEQLAQKISRYREARRAAGLAPEEGRVTLMLHSFVAPTMAEVEGAVQAPLRAYLESSVDLWRQRSEPLEGLDPAERDAVLAFAARRYREQSALIGTPDQCGAMLERVRAAGVDEVACLVDFGVEHDAVLRSLEQIDALRRGADAGVSDVMTEARTTEWSPRQRQLIALVLEEVERQLGRSLPDGEQTMPQSVGLDSIAAVELGQRLGERLRLALPATLWFDHPTIEAAAAYIGRLERGEDVGGVEEDLERDAVLPVEITAAGKPVAHAVEPRRVLLTGATGFLGAYVLHTLLEQTSARIACLVRASSTGAGAQRLEAALAQYDLWDPSFAERIEPLVGDLAAPGLGLPTHTLDELAASLDVIVHNGAVVNFAYAYATCRPANVGGTLEVLRLACRGARLVPVQYVSTMAVFSHAYAGCTVTPDHVPADHERLDMGYSRSKWVAERLVTQARERGLPVAIHRPGLVTGAAQTGVCHDTNFIWNLVRVSVRIGALPDYDRVIDMTPVDWAARAIVRTALDPDRMDAIVHLVNPRPTSIFALQRWLSSRGHVVRIESFERWQIRVMQEVCANPSLSALLPVLSLAAADFYARAQVRFGDPEMPMVHEASSDPCPPADDALLDTYRRYFVDTGFLPAPDAAPRSRPRVQDVLDGQRLHEMVVEITGVTDLDGHAWREPLDVLLDDMRRQHYRTGGLERAGSRLLMGLIRRTQLVDVRRRHPEIAGVPIERPVVIAAPPRTGTTLLHNLLAVDPENDAFALWELMSPVTPAHATGGWDAHMRGVAAELVSETYERAPRLRAIHPLAADAPDECHWLLQSTAASLVNAVCAHAPGYVEWMLQADMRPAYRFHRQALQALSWRRPGQRLILKDPWHLWHLDALLDTYPDAIVICLHRDVHEVLPSLCSLAQALQSVEAEPTPGPVLGRYCLDLLDRGMQRMREARTKAPDAFVDVDYRALVDDPVGTLRTLYGAMGRTLEPSGEEAIEAWLRAHPRDAHGRHRYDLAMFGLDPAEVGGRFER